MAKPHRRLSPSVGALAFAGDDAGVAIWKVIAARLEIL
ncbi:hypothetical protein HDC35_003665 [Sphingopyxis sp. JAI128]|nr:hypothetical protein [Sphingopyxis sp. JAI128]